jgi:hypothetical protein
MRCALFFALLCCFVLTACSCIKPADTSNDPVPEYGIEYPPLLQPEAAHSVRLKLEGTVPDLTKEDLQKIKDLIGRVPRLTWYEVRHIRKSVLHPGAIEVYVDYMCVVIKKEQDWRVVRFLVPSH